MSFKPQHRLSYALELYDSEFSGEVHNRCIIHQAYYAALNQVQYEIENRLFFIVDDEDRKKQSHKAFIDACENQLGKLVAGDVRRQLLISIVNNLRRAKRLRETADYRLDSNIDKTSAQVALRHAQEIFDTLEQFD